MSRNNVQSSPIKRGLSLLSNLKLDLQISLGKTNGIDFPFRLHRSGLSIEIFAVQGTNKSRKGSWDSNAIRHCEGAHDLQPCLARSKKIVGKIVQNTQ